MTNGLGKTHMDRVALQKIKDLMPKHENIGIVVGANPTLDEMGGALALYLALEQLQKKVTVASPTDPLVEISSLVGIDKVSKNLGAGDGDLIVSFPYADGEIEKVSYTIEDNLLNIVVKAGQNGLKFSESDIQYKRGGATPSLLFVIGTPRISDLGSLFDTDALKDTVVVNIDNKADNQGFGDIVLVSPKFSSVSEQVASLLAFLQAHIDVDTAQNLISGISWATDNFQKPNTSFLAFEMAGMLLRRGAQRQQNNLARQQPQFSQTDESDFLMPETSIEDLGQPKKEPMTKQNTDVKTQQREDKNPPPDWLMPKVYRGSTNLS